MSNNILAVHAPSPWSRDKYGNLLDANGRNVLFRGVTIAVSGSMVAEAEKNTDLIAVTPDLLAALNRLIAIDDAHATLHASDGDDVARMIEHAEAHKFAREVLVKVAK